jgi:excisionase family DNA binding protein
MLTRRRAFKKSANLNNADPQSAAILTKQQAASLLQCTPRFLERQIAAGRLRACKITSKFVRIRRKDLEAFLAQGATMEAGR